MATATFNEKALRDERNLLNARKFAGPWTKDDEVRLRWLNWQLDQEKKS